MNLGETLYKLRTENNLSQGDLAERLEVSRQSISKWENNSAVPDLDKIVKLSEVFGVTLDELIKGKTREAKTKEDSEKVVRSYVEEQEMVKPMGSEPNAEKSEATFPLRIMAGIVLFSMAFLLIVTFAIFGAAFAGVLFAVPFLICGIICFVCKENIGLWCAWVVFAYIYTFMIYATGIRAGNILYSLHWTEAMNYTRLAFAWILFASEIALMVVTAIKLRNTNLKEERADKKRLFLSWIVVIGIQVLARSLPFLSLMKYMMVHVMSYGAMLNLISIIVEWAKMIALTIALTNTLRFLYRRKRIEKIR